MNNIDYLNLGTCWCVCCSIVCGMEYIKQQMTVLKVDMLNVGIIGKRKYLSEFDMG